jgi:hypothetical protein
VIYQAGERVFASLELTPDRLPQWLSLVHDQLEQLAHFFEVSQHCRRVRLESQWPGFAQAGASLLRQISTLESFCDGDANGPEIRVRLTSTALELWFGESTALLELPEADPQPWLGFVRAELAWLALQSLLFRMAKREVLTRILKQLPRPELEGFGLRMLDGLSGVQPERVVFLGEGTYLGLSHYAAITSQKLADCPAYWHATSRLHWDPAWTGPSLVVVYQSDVARDADAVAIELLPSEVEVLLLTDVQRSAGESRPMRVIECGRWANAVLRPSLSLWLSHYVIASVAAGRGRNLDRPTAK